MVATVWGTPQTRHDIMKAKRKRHDAQFKARVALEALKGVKGKRPDPKAIAAKEAEYAASQFSLTRQREAEDKEDDAWDPDQGVAFEVPALVCQRSPCMPRSVRTPCASPALPWQGPAQ